MAEKAKTEQLRQTKRCKQQGTGCCSARTRNISLFLAMNSLVFSRSRRTGGSVVCAAAASLLRIGAFTSARESMDFTNSAGENSYAALGRIAVQIRKGNAPVDANALLPQVPFSCAGSDSWCLRSSSRLRLSSSRMAKTSSSDGMRNGFAILSTEVPAPPAEDCAVEMLAVDLPLDMTCRR